MQLFSPMLTQDLQVARGCGDDPPQASSIIVELPIHRPGGRYVNKLHQPLKSLDGFIRASLADQPTNFDLGSSFSEPRQGTNRRGLSLQWAFAI